MRLVLHPLHEVANLLTGGREQRLGLVLFVELQQETFEEVNHPRLARSIVKGLEQFIEGQAKAGRRFDRQWAAGSVSWQQAGAGHGLHPRTSKGDEPVIPFHGRTRGRIAEAKMGAGKGGPRHGALDNLARRVRIAHGISQTARMTVIEHPIIDEGFIDPGAALRGVMAHEDLEAFKIFHAQIVLSKGQKLQSIQIDLLVIRVFSDGMIQEAPLAPQTVAMPKTSHSPFQLGEEAIEQFYREGYFLAPQFLTQDAVNRMNEDYAAEVEKLGGSTDWRALPFQESAQKELYADRITEMMGRLLGGEVELWLGMYAVVMPGAEGLAWHQDNQYTHILGHMCNAFVALDEITPENAGLWLAPRSHLLGRQPNLNTGKGHRRAADPDNPVAIERMQPGDAVIFHRELLHHSKTNQSEQPRRAFAFQVSSANCRFAETGKLVEPKKQK